MSNALDKSLDVAKKMQKDYPDVTFVFVGDGVEKARLMKRAEDENITNAFFLPPVSKRSVPDLLRHFDCSYMTGLPSPLYRFGLCLNKMYDSMMGGIPVVCAFDAPDTIIRQYGCGIQCEPENENEVIDAIRTIRGMTPDERRSMGAKGREAVMSRFTYKVLAGQFLDSIK